ncbi:hypothetical protein Tco_0740295 [Tanacetum coccineum]
MVAQMEEEVYVCQPPGFKDHPNNSLITFYKVKQKDDGIFISQDKYMADILKKFDFVIVKTASTPIETNKALLKDEESENVDVHLYRSMIGSLMYLTASWLDIMSDVCACARFQVTPKMSHLHDVKRIFRYLKGQPKLGLWYPRDSLFDLEAFSDSDYAGASLDRKSTTGGKVTLLFDSMLLQNQALEGEGSSIPPEPQPTPSTSQTNVLEPQTETPPRVSHELQTKAHIEQILQSPSTYQRKQRKTQNLRRAKKVPLSSHQTSVPLRPYHDNALMLTFRPQLDKGAVPRRQETMGSTLAQTRPKRVLEKPNEPPLPEGHTSGSKEGCM